MLADLLDAYRRGETDAQHALLEEMEPLLYGMVRSMSPGAAADPEGAVRHAHALTLAFHLRACRGEVAADRPAALRALAHRMAVKRLADPEPLPLADLADPETGSMVYRCLGLGLAAEEALTPAEQAAFLARLEGAPPAPPEAWASARPKLRRAGFLAEPPAAS